MKFGNIVIYSENGIEYDATVLSSRQLDHHEGSDGEPLLGLGFFKEVGTLSADKKEFTPKNVLGTQAQNDLVQFRLDVAHESHEFGDEAKKVGFKAPYAGGRWREKEISSFTGRVAGDI